VHKPVNPGEKSITGRNRPKNYLAEERTKAKGKKEGRGKKKKNEEKRDSPEIKKPGTGTGGS